MTPGVLCSTSWAYAAKYEPKTERFSPLLSLAHAAATLGFLSRAGDSVSGFFGGSEAQLCRFSPDSIASTKKRDQQQSDKCDDWVATT